MDIGRAHQEKLLYDATLSKCNDFIRCVDFTGTFKRPDHLIILESKAKGFSALPGCDHAWLGDTYRKALDDTCRELFNHWSQQ